MVTLRGASVPQLVSLFFLNNFTEPVLKDACSGCHDVFHTITKINNHLTFCPQRNGIHLSFSSSFANNTLSNCDSKQVSQYFVCETENPWNRRQLSRDQFEAETYAVS